MGISTSYIGAAAVAACIDVKRACWSEDLGDANRSVWRSRDGVGYLIFGISTSYVGPEAVAVFVGRHNGMLE